MSRSSLHVQIKRIHAGKFRRYHHVPPLRQLADLPTLGKNIRDFFVTSVGFCQSFVLLLKFRPDVVFTKGGFVCVPLGLAAKVLNIPLVIHDSDAHPDSADQILSRWATTIATGSPIKHYPYPQEKTRYVGIPVDESFTLVGKKRQLELKAKLGFHDLKKPLIAVMGSGNGARIINRAMASVVSQLLERACVYHITGQPGYSEFAKHAPEHIDYHIVPFSTQMATVMGAADIVVSRSGTTIMQELAALAKAVIMVPNPYLRGGHQLKNAQVYIDAHAALIVDEEELEKNPLVLHRAIERLLDNPEERQALGRALSTLARPEAAIDMASLIVEAVSLPKTQIKREKT